MFSLLAAAIGAHLRLMGAGGASFGCTADAVGNRIGGMCCGSECVSLAGAGNRPEVFVLWADAHCSVCSHRDPSDITISRQSLHIRPPGQEASSPSSLNIRPDPVEATLPVDCHPLGSCRRGDRVRSKPQLSSVLAERRFGCNDNASNIVKGKYAWEEESTPACEHVKVTHGTNHSDFAPWTEALGKAVREEHRDAIWAVSPAAFKLFLGDGACGRVEKRDAFGDGFSGGEIGSNSGDIRSALSEVATQPQPVELLLFALAFAHLSCASMDGSSREVVNTRHPAVEAFLLKYTCLNTCSALRKELAAWCPDGQRSATERHAHNRFSVPAPLPMEAIGAAGSTVSFEVFAGFVSAHASPLATVYSAFSSLPPEGGDENVGHVVNASFARLGLETALWPLLAEIVVDSKDVADAAQFARQVCREAVQLAIRDNPARQLSARNVGAPMRVKEFLELHSRAATLTRILVMHLTGDVQQWRRSSGVAFLINKTQ